MLLHLVGFLLTLNYDARNYELTKKKINHVTVNNEKFVPFFVVHLFLSFLFQLFFFCLFFFLGTFLGTVTRLRNGRSWLRFVADARDISLLRGTQTLPVAHLLSCFFAVSP